MLPWGYLGLHTGPGKYSSHSSYSAEVKVILSILFRVRRRYKKPRFVAAGPMAKIHGSLGSLLNTLLICYSFSFNAVAWKTIIRGCVRVHASVTSMSTFSHRVDRKRRQSSSTKAAEFCTSTGCNMRVVAQPGRLSLSHGSRSSCMCFNIHFALKAGEARRFQSI